MRERNRQPPPESAFCAEVFVALRVFVLSGVPPIDAAVLSSCTFHILQLKSPMRERCSFLSRWYLVAVKARHHA
jgi:hypothetical protein